MSVCRRDLVKSIFNSEELKCRRANVRLVGLSWGASCVGVDVKKPTLKWEVRVGVFAKHGFWGIDTHSGGESMIPTTSIRNQHVGWWRFIVLEPTPWCQLLGAKARDMGLGWHGSIKIMFWLLNSKSECWSDVQMVFQCYGVLWSNFNVVDLHWVRKQ